MVVKIGEHFESDIEVLENKDGQLIVKKTYNNHVPCIRFLNILLKKYYAPHAREIMPVAMHEYIILKMLEPYRIAPRPLAIEKSSIYLSYEGNPITEHSTEITRQTYLWQARRILHTLRHLGIRHNDLLLTAMFFLKTVRSKSLISLLLNMAILALQNICRIQTGHA